MDIKKLIFYNNIFKNKIFIRLFIFLFLFGYVYLFITATEIINGNLTIRAFNMTIFYVYTVFIYALIPICSMILVDKKLVEYNEYFIFITPFINYVIFIVCGFFYTLINPIESEWMNFYAFPYMLASFATAFLIPTIYFFILVVKSIINLIKNKNNNSKL